MLELSDQAAQLRDHQSGVRPASTRWMLSKPLLYAFVQLSHVGPALCGVEVTFGSEKSGVVLCRRLLHHHVEAGGPRSFRRERLMQRVLVHDAGRGRC